MKGPLFYAKILLFGEYGIIKIQRPSHTVQFKGALKSVSNPSDEAVNSNKDCSFCQYLKI